MLMLHATTDVCARGIDRDGRFRADKSRQRRKAVWFTTPGNTRFALAHAMARHNVGPERVVFLWVDLSRSWLRRHKGNLYYVYGDVPAERIRRTGRVTIQVTEV